MIFDWCCQVTPVLVEGKDCSKQSQHASKRLFTPCLNSFSATFCNKIKHKLSSIAFKKLGHFPSFAKDDSDEGKSFTHIFAVKLLLLQRVTRC